MAKTPGYVGHVVSHTHWDRAWYLPFEVFRIRLVTLVKKLLDIMEKDRAYKFCFDSQMLPLEDYFEIYPEDRPRVERLVKEGRLAIGPFYALPDQYLVTGESLIRNLAIGIRQAKALGSVSMEGALSDVFGHPAQVPQILAGFGIRSAIFVRGLTLQQKKRGWVQRWIAPDARSSVIMYFLPGGGYASLYLWGTDSFDPALYPTLPTDMDEWSVDLALKHVERAFADYRIGGMTTNQLWFGNGVDHQEAQPHTPALIKAVNERQDWIRLVHSTYEQMIDAVVAEKRRLPIITGQFRPGLHGTMTSRVYLKQDYARIAGRLEMLAEPLLAIADIFGAGHRAFREPRHNAYTFNPGQNWAAFRYYPAGQMEHLWKLLLQNSPHDDVCGCSVDRTHRDMENRFERAGEMCEYFVKDALLLCASRIAQRLGESRIPAVVAFNPHPFTWRDRVRVRAFLPGARTSKALSVVDSKGRAIPFVVESAARIARYPWNGNNFQKDGVPGLDVALAIAPEMKGLSFAAFRIATNAARQRETAGASAKRADGKAIIENAFYKASIHRDGTFDLLDKRLAKRFNGLAALEDVEDCGDSYMFRRFEKPGEPVSSRGAKGKVRIISHDAISTVVEVAFDMLLPVSLTRDRKSRDKTTIACPVRIRYEMPHFRKGLRITVSVDNRAKDHEMYLAFPTGLATGSYDFDSKFDFDTYKIGEPVGRIDSLAIVKQGRAALGVVGECPTLLQSRKDRGRATLLWSLFRSVDFVTASIPREFWDASEAQCLRKITRTYEIVTGDYRHVRREALKLRRAIIAPVTAVPVTPWDRNRYKDKRFTALGIPDGGPIVSIPGDDVHFSAFKRSEDGGGWVVRVYSLAPSRQRCSIATRVPVTGACLCDLSEKPQSRLTMSADGQFAFAIGPKEIKTILLRLDRAALAASMVRKPAVRHDA